MLKASCILNVITGILGLLLALLSFSFLNVTAYTILHATGLLGFSFCTVLYSLMTIAEKDPSQDERNRFLLDEEKLVVKKEPRKPVVIFLGLMTFLNGIYLLYLLLQLSGILYDWNLELSPGGYSIAAFIVLFAVSLTYHPFALLYQIPKKLEKLS